MATERIQIIVSSRGAVTVKREIDEIGRSSQKTAGGVDMLKGAIAGFITGSAVATVVRYADTYTNLQNKLRLVTSGTADLAEKTAALFGIAQENRQSMEGVANFYARASNALAAYGLGAAEAVEFTDLFTKSVALSGASTNEQTQGIYQFTQALNKGKLDGDEFRTVMETFPYVARLITEELGVTKAQLYSLSETGQLTAPMLVEAFKNASASIRDDFSQLAPTIGGALTTLQNSFLMLVGTVSEGTGIFTLAAYAIQGIANNLGLVVLALTPVIAGFTVLAVQIIGGLMATAWTSFVAGAGAAIAAMGRLALVMAANPFAALIIGIVAVMAYFTDWKLLLINLQFEIGKVIESLGRLFGSVGMTNAGITIQIDARDAYTNLQKAAEDIKKKTAEGGNLAGGEMKKKIIEGGKEVAFSLENAQKIAAARYAEMNGLSADKILSGLKEGGDYIYNQVTGAITAAAPALTQSMAAGSQTAASTIEGGMVSGAQKAGATIYNSVESAFASLAPLLEVFEAFHRRENTELRKISAETAKLSQEAMTIRADRARGPSRPERRGGYSGGGGSSYSGGGGGISGTIGGSQLSYNGNPKARTVDAGSAGNTNIKVPVVITNVLDPTMAVQANESASGQRSILNVIKMNRDEVNYALGVS